MTVEPETEEGRRTVDVTVWVELQAMVAGEKVMPPLLPPPEMRTTAKMIARTSTTPAPPTTAAIIPLFDDLAGA